jgi:hypothetical protein
MSQHDDLGLQPCLRLDRRDHDVEDQNQERDHLVSDYMIVSRRLVDGVFGMHTRRSRNLGHGMHELQRGVAGIESTQRANSSGRQAMVPNDCGKAAGPSRKDGPHWNQAPAFSRLRLSLAPNY